MDKYIELVESAKKHAVLYHYTNIDSLKCILENRSLRLSRIDTVNDPKENDRIKSLWSQKVFLFCFTYEEDNSEYFYREYGKMILEFDQKDIVDDRLFFDSELTGKFKYFDDYNRRSQVDHNSYDEWQDWCMFDFSIADVYYTDDLNAHHAEDGLESNAGLIKAKTGFDVYGNVQNWSIEAETRIRATLRPVGLESGLNRRKKMEHPVPNFKYIFMSLPQVLRIEISPFISESERYEICEVLERYGFKDKLNP